MITDDILNNIGFSPLTERLYEVAKSSSSAPYMKKAPMREEAEELCAQIAELIRGLGYEDEVKDAIRVDLENMGVRPYMGETDAMLSYREYRRQFAVKSELLLRLAEECADEVREVMSFVGAQIERVCAGIGDWRAYDEMERVWGDVVKDYLERTRGCVRWVIDEEASENDRGVWGWWVTEEASGFRFWQDDYSLPGSPDSLERMLESAFNCRLLPDRKAERGTFVLEHYHHRLMKDVRPPLVEEGWRLSGIDAIGEDELRLLTNDSLYQLTCRINHVRKGVVDPYGRLCLWQLEALTEGIWLSEEFN